MKTDFTLQAITETITSCMSDLDAKRHAYDSVVAQDQGRDFVSSLSDNDHISGPEVIYDADALSIIDDSQLFSFADHNGLDYSPIINLVLSRNERGENVTAKECVLVEANEIVSSASFGIMSQIGDDIDEITKSIEEEIHFRDKLLYTDVDSITVQGASYETADTLELVHISTLNFLDNNIYRDGNLYTNDERTRIYLIASHLKADQTRDYVMASAPLEGSEV